MKTPAFWRKRSFLARLLKPLSSFYEMADTLSKARIRPVVLPVPVICVGNLTAGGAGKTPTALYIGQYLKSKDMKAFFLSRGYGGKLEGPVLVNPKKHTALHVGDEPLLLASVLPTVVAKDKLKGAQLAISKGAKVIIMDDGLQNPSIVKHLALLVVDGERGFGNGYVIPAGPLREKPETGFKRAHAIIVLNRTTATPKLPSDRPAFYARTIPRELGIFKNKKILAFCGLAYPQKFFDMLSGSGAKVVDQVAFADHHPYTPLDMRKLLLKAFTEDAALVTTAKDFVRLPEKYKDCVAVLDIDLEFDNPAIFESVIDYILKQHETA